MLWHEKAGSSQGPHGVLQRECRQCKDMHGLQAWCSLPTPIHWDNRRRPGEAKDSNSPQPTSFSRPEGPICRQSQPSPPMSLRAEETHSPQFAVHQSSPSHCSRPVSILSFPDCSGCPGLMKSLQGPRLGMVCPLLPLWSPLSRGLSHPYPNASNNPDTNQSSLWSQGKKYDSKLRTSH